MRARQLIFEGVCRDMIPRPPRRLLLRAAAVQVWPGPPKRRWRAAFLIFYCAPPAPAESRPAAVQVAARRGLRSICHAIGTSPRAPLRLLFVCALDVVV